MGWLFPKPLLWNSNFPCPCLNVVISLGLVKVYLFTWHGFTGVTRLLHVGIDQMVLLFDRRHLCAQHLDLARHRVQDTRDFVIHHLTFVDLILSLG